jgi:hypothetical protein
MIVYHHSNDPRTDRIVFGGFKQVIQNLVTGAIGSSHKEIVIFLKTARPYFEGYFFIVYYLFSEKFGRFSIIVVYS